MSTATMTASTTLAPVDAATLVGPFLIRCEGNGNPDHGQYAPVANVQVLEVKTLAEIPAIVREYVDFWNLGGGNWTGRAGEIRARKGGKVVARVSYNGRLWTPKGAAITL
jgi:hypothetical protein